MKNSLNKFWVSFFLMIMSTSLALGQTSETKSKILRPLDTDTGIEAKPDSTIKNFPAGKAFLFMLPRGIKGEQFARFEVVRAPALSWLVDRSFYWDTSIRDTGKHTIVFHAFTKENIYYPITLAIEVTD